MHIVYLYKDYKNIILKKQFVWILDFKYILLLLVLPSDFYNWSAQIPDFSHGDQSLSRLCHTQRI